MTVAELAVSKLDLKG